MPQQDWLVLMGMGGGFILLGLIAIIWGGREEKGYYNSLSGHKDVREFMEHWPPRPQFGALKIGGRIAIIIGVLLLATGIILRLWA
ncbi:MAG: hypothetical protein HYY41_01710 [Chloroflexi bacterium]|nr:hypothetical protein [Chloroflexota bacterium]